MFGERSIVALDEAAGHSLWPASDIGLLPRSRVAASPLIMHAVATRPKSALGKTVSLTTCIRSCDPSRDWAAGGGLRTGVKLSARGSSIANQGVVRNLLQGRSGSRIERDEVK